MTLIYQHAYKYRYDVPLQVVFDEQGGENQSMILGGIDHFRRLAAKDFPDFKVPLPQFMPDTDEPGLQAADLIAWLARKDAVNAYKQADRSKLPEGVLLAQALTIPSTMKIWSEEDVKKAAESLAIDIMKQLRGV